MSLRCVLVDDSEEFLASATRLLRSQGVEVVGTAMNGDDARALVTEVEPDVALVDIELAEEDGVALSAELDGATRVVLISAYERDDLGELIAGSPALGFLPKSELGATAITKLIGSR